jgi:hypothetical protein
MKHLILLILFIFPLLGWGQNAPVKHPRVAEVEERLRDEAARYFSRRFPGQPFFVKVEVNPLRRDAIGSRKTESLPYFDYESEESVDEWDDPNTPIAFLRHRVTKVMIEISVPENFADARVGEIKDEIAVYLKLLPFRDEIKVEKKIPEVKSSIPTYVYILGAAFIFASLIGGFIIRSGFTKMKTSSNTSTPSSAPAMAMPSAPNPSKSRDEGKKSSTAVSGDVTFHDPIKTIDIVHLKLDQIAKSETFPTLTDVISLYEMGEELPERLGALLCEMPSDWQKNLFPLGQGQAWLEAFCHPGRIDHECLMTLDRLGKERLLTGPDRQWENLLIQVWRMNDKAIGFFKKIPQDHAFMILNMLPKTFSVGAAKKAFPGAWGKLLENKSSQVIIAANVLQDYLGQALQLEPKYDWKLLESYRKDRELLQYLDRVSIDDEKDVYETLPDDSFVFRVRPPFYIIFEQEGEPWKQFVGKFPIDRWALVVMNSSRNFIKQVSEAMDEKQRIIFSQYLKQYDQGFSLDDQSEWRNLMAKEYGLKARTKPVDEKVPEPEAGDNVKSA